MSGVHILLAVLSVLGGIAFWMYRARGAAGTARDVADAAETVINLPRRLTFLRKSGKTGLSLVDDPRDAAAVMMVEIARADGEITTTQRAAILEQLTGTLEMSKSEAEETYINAAWISRDAPTAEKTMEKMAQVISGHELIGARETEQLHAALLHVASTDRPPTDAQTALLDLAQEKL